MNSEMVKIFGNHRSAIRTSGIMDIYCFMAQSELWSGGPGIKKHNNVHRQNHNCNQTTAV